MPKKSVTKKIETRVVGMQFHTTQSFRKTLRRNCSQGRPIDCTLTRDPKNEHDTNAIRVTATNYDIFIGYLPKGVAEVLSERIDSGKWVFKRAVLMSVGEYLEEGDLLVTLKTA